MESNFVLMLSIAQIFIEIVVKETVSSLIEFFAMLGSLGAAGGAFYAAHHSRQAAVEANNIAKFSVLKDALLDLKRNQWWLLSKFNEKSPDCEEPYDKFYLSKEETFELLCRMERIKQHIPLLDAVSSDGEQLAYDLLRLWDSSRGHLGYLDMPPAGVPEKETECRIKLKQEAERVNNMLKSLLSLEPAKKNLG